MILRRLQAQGFRNIESCDISFESGVNLLVGENAQGKTNAMECIYYFARGKSFRGSSDASLIRYGDCGFSASISFCSNEREQTLSYTLENGVRDRRRNGVPLKKLSEMLGHFRAVLFFPEHLQIIKAGPYERREFLNIAISQNNPLYIGLYSEYNRILENRNILLKYAQKGLYVDTAELDAWSEQMARVAARIYMHRLSYVRGLAPYAEAILRDLSGQRETLSLSYLADIQAEGEEEAYLAYLKLLESERGREMAAGYSLFGIHRDDLEVEINGHSAREFGSQGQQRSCVLALKMAEGEYSRVLTGEYPVFLFDDVLSELDEKRRSYVLGDTGERQFILSACERLPENSGYHEIRVEGGRYVSTHR